MLPLITEGFCHRLTMSYWVSRCAVCLYVCTLIIVHAFPAHVDEISSNVPFAEVWHINNYMYKSLIKRRNAVIDDLFENCLVFWVYMTHLYWVLVIVVQVLFHCSLFRCQAGRHCSDVGASPWPATLDGSHQGMICGIHASPLFFYQHCRYSFTL